MTSGVLVTIKLDLFQQTFLRNYFGHQETPFRFPDGNSAAKDLVTLLSMLLREPHPRTQIVGNGNLDFLIETPVSRFKDPLLFCSLSERGASFFASKIADFIQLVFHEKVTEYVNAGIEYKDTVFLFMDEFDLPDDSYDRLIKEQQRWRERIRKQNHKKKMLKNFKKQRSSLHVLS